MSTLKTHNLQSPDAGSVNIVMAPNAGMVVAGISTFNNKVLIGTNTVGDSTADDLTIATSGSTGITLRSDSGYAGNIQFSDGTSGDDQQRGIIQYHHSDNSMRFFTDAVRRVTIGNSGNFYIGQTSGAEQLGVDGGSNAQTFSTNSTNSNGNMLQVKCSGTTKLFLGSAGSFVTGNTGTTNQGIRAEGDLLFAAGGHTERLRISSTGQVKIQSGTVIQFTNTNNDITTDTSDGSDNKRIVISGGGATDSSRGANINLTGNEYGSVNGKLELTAGNSGNSNSTIDFYTGGTQRLEIAQNGNLILNATTGGSVALLKAGGSNTDLRVASVGTGGFFDVQTNGTNNRMRVDANGHFYQNAQRTRLTYGGLSACSLRWNINSGANLTQNNSNRDNYGKLNIQAGRANSTTVNDDCTAIRITPAEVRNAAVGTKSCGIGFMHLNADQWPEYSGNQTWMGLSLNDTSGQERDRFEIHTNTNTGQGSQPNNLAMRIYPSGEMARPNQPMFFGMGRSGSISNSTWTYIKPSSVAFDIGSNYINSGTYEGGFEAPVDGTYMCIMDGLVYPLGENQFAQTRFKKNGSVYGQVKQFNGNSSNHTGHSQTVLMQCSAGDKINQEYYTNSNSGYPYGSQWHFIVYLVG